MAFVRAYMYTATRQRNPSQYSHGRILCPTRGKIQGKTNYYLTRGLEQRLVPFRKYTCSTYCLKTFKDIENLKKIAEQMDQWRILCTRIQKEAEALQSDDYEYDAERR
ncbi:hypothetical protein ElyMa_006625200 [Elysia marginata]|uniref:Uncharacterized protein n=1 Tax=Elysia marginata TaxID=1093978 RepID=A0AAV4IJ53_9GAST|nr:hypothetical protein ElyMa_006625200 [Elysia marginata]